MPAPINELKKRLSAKECLIGCWASLADAYVTEVTARAGFDWVLLDGEHAPGDLRSLVSQLQALGDTPAVVRLPAGDPVAIKQVLDIGAQTLLIPMVESAEEAAMLVRACRYPPRGTRGVGAALGRASRFGAITDYQATADEQICLIVQVENRAGLAALDAILALEGVDGVFIGPADLAADMGLAIDDPAAEKTVLDALARIEATAKFAGVFSTSQAFLARAKDAGTSFLGVAADSLVLSEALRARATAWKKA
ncbi:MAG: HpcH/HpaI aldolase/citrate lyase family protein [Pseudomonadota bacterium]